MNQLITANLLESANIKLIIGGIALVIILVLVAIFGSFFKIWLRAKVSGAPVGFLTLIAMALRGIPNAKIIDARIAAFKAGRNYSTDNLEAHLLAGGSVDEVVLSLIAADKAGISLDWDRACAIDLAVKGTGKTVLEAVRTSIKPAGIDCPNPSSGKD